MTPPPRRYERRRHRRGIKRVTIIALTAALVSTAIVLAVGYASFKEFAEGQHLREDLIYSSSIRANLQRVYEDLLSAESAVRGYVISGREEFRQPLDEVRGVIVQEIEGLAALAVERPQHAVALAELSRLAEEQMRVLEEMVQAREAAGTLAASAVLSAQRGKAVMDRIRTIVHGVIASEVAGIDRRTLQVRVAGQRTKETMILLLGAAIAIVGGSTIVVVAHLVGRRRAEQALADTLSRHRAILASAMDTILTVNERGLVETANPAATRLLGFSQDELIGRHIATLFRVPAEESDGAFMRRLADDAAGGTVRELSGLRQDGSEVPVDMAVGQMRAGDSQRYVAILHDITERKRTEIMKNEFVSTVSHELRTPLTSISGSLGLLAGGAVGALPDAAQRLISIAHQNSRRLVRLINDILDIEKMQSATITFAREPVNMADVATEAIEQNRGYSDQHQVTLELEVSEGDTSVVGDHDRLIQVLTNLISNAVKFSPPQSRVTVRVERTGDTVRVAVQDRGAGMPEEFRNRVFSRFAQADTSDTRARGGTGLGLAIVKEIVDRHAGRVTFETETGAGTTFFVDLPARALANEPRASRSGAAVMLVEDDPSSAMTIRELLTRSGIATDVAASAAEAESLAALNPYQAILVDLGLPDRDGISLIRTLRQHRRTEATPILIVSGRRRDSVREGEADGLQVVDWIEKPVDSRRLRESIARAIDREGTPRVLHLDDDPDMRTLVAEALRPVAKVRSVASVAEAVEALRVEDFDLAILDIALQGSSGLDALPHLFRRSGDRVPVIVFSAHDADPAVARRIDAALVKSHVSLDHLARTVTRLVARDARRSTGAAGEIP